MIYEFFVKIAGAHISSLIYFILLNTSYTDTALTISAQLRSPATKEIVSIVKSGFIFKIRFYGSVTVNNQKVYRLEQIKRLSYKDSQWYVDDNLLSNEYFQDTLGRCTLIFNELPLKDHDQVVVYFSASVLPESDFEKSTGLTTAILWNYYIPHIKLNGSYNNGRLLLKE